MSFPPPPGLSNFNSASSTSGASHPSLPARPPSTTSRSSFKPAFSTNASTNSSSGYGYPNGHSNMGQAHMGSVAYANQNNTSVMGGGGGYNEDRRSQGSMGYAGHAAPQSYSAPQSSYGQYQTSQQQYGYGQSNSDYYNQSAAPQIRNPFPVPQPGDKNAYDPEMEAQIAQWQSAYASKDDAMGSRLRTKAEGAASAGGANALPLGSRNVPSAAAAPMSNSDMGLAANSDTGVASVVSGADGKQKTVVRSGGGQTWQDTSLLEWDPAHFRLFIGNLAGEVTDESLLKAFARFTSVQKARVVREKRTTKSKGYGFVSFSNGDDYFQAARDMQGKYIGSHPVLIKRSTTEIRPTVPHDKKKNFKGGKGGGGQGGKAHPGSGIQKKQSKTKGGLRILG